MVIGYILGIPITTVVLYFGIIRPLLMVLARAPQGSVRGRIATVVSWVVLITLVNIVLTIIFLVVVLG